MKRSAAALVGGPVVAVLLSGCGSDPVEFSGLLDAPTELSAWGLFADAAAQVPAAGVVPYDLETALFSDYSLKLRFVRLPEGMAADYSADDSFAFPVGTVLVKTFAYASDARRPSDGVQLLETRLLVHQEDGWVGLPYVWNEAQNEARLRIAGAHVEARWVDEWGEAREHDYLVPNVNQCKGCHRVKEKTMQPIGPKARYLNHDFEYPSGRENQLAYWSRNGMLRGAPAPAQAPAVPVWDDPESGTVEERARAYLEINCAHCHNPGGPGRTTGLDLTWGERRPKELGIFKSPIAAGRGTGDRRFGIVPGQPDESILVFRLLSVDPGVMMPELGRRLVHGEGVALVRRWIDEMAPAT